MVKFANTFSVVKVTMHTEACCVNFSHNVGFDLLKFCFECHYLSLQCTLVWSLLIPSLSIFFFFGIKVILSHHCKTFLPSYLSGRICVKLVLFLSACVLVVICRSFRNTNSISFIDERSYVLSSIFLKWLCQFISFKEFVHCSQIAEFVWYKIVTCYLLILQNLWWCHINFLFSFWDRVSV